MSGAVYPLQDNQMRAVDPGDSVWLSASAGTGKTQVLSARVLRLLLDPAVRPEQILCLTFTKAGAAEMAVRVNEVLANWVRMPAEMLAKDLLAIGADAGRETLARARSLFAAVLDCPGGGLRIDTIHAFAQWLLAAFPNEAGLVPGTRPMEDRDRDLLAARVLADLIEQWDASDPAAMAALEDLSVRLGPADVRSWLMRCASARDAWFGPAGWQPPMREKVARLIGLASDASLADADKLCTDQAFAIASLRAWRAVYAEWGTKTALASLEAIDLWLASDPAARREGLAGLVAALWTKDGAIRSLASLQKIDPAIGTLAEQVGQSIAAVRDLVVALELVDVLTPALELGWRYAIAWDEAKQREGFVDFDDLIRRAAGLLADAGQGEWIRYKLDRRFDHILVDEAQDTNASQWAIIDALTDDFFAGIGAAEERQRTIFVVGDYKQAIFGFQGTSPDNFLSKRDDYAARLRQRAANAGQLREKLRWRELQDLDLGRSYRTSQHVLSFVDEAIDAIGHEAFGLSSRPARHEGDERPGLVTLWAPVPGAVEENEEEDGPELRVSEPERRMADKIAQTILGMWNGGFALKKGGHRNATPGDFMVLVRKRRELAGLIVARLHAAGVPVAGVDRLRLAAPLAVQDLMAAMRFAAQPSDDLQLASLLVSPLIGWSHEQLLEHGYRGGNGTSLWRHLREKDHAEAQAATSMLLDLLARADYESPQALLHWVLVGPWQGRRKLLKRLGSEAADPIDELLNAALQFAGSNTPSLQGFIRWFDAGEGELKREAEGGGDFVRVMTVHGSKGLQAPIVILADACGNPDNGKGSGLELLDEPPGGGPSRPIPILPLSKDERIGPVAEAAEAAKAQEREEHWRLLYVAMTRAEEALFIGGALGKSEKEPAPDSWYARLAPLFAGEPLADPLWGMRLERGERAPPFPHLKQQALPIPEVLPAWATTPIGEEPRPPRPLAPSSAATEELGADPPLPVAQAAIAARRGVLIHALLERLPDAPEEMRAAGGRAWLARHAADLDEDVRGEMLERALAVLAEPDWRDLFGPQALAEVPLAAIVGAEVVAGTVDRLLVTPERILVADFKTARRPPENLDEVPRSTLAQMAAYVAALEVIYPGRAVDACVLYTQVPRLIALPEAVLAAHKPGLTQGQ